MTENVSLPTGWLEIELRDLFSLPSDDIVDGPFGSNLKASEYVSTGVPIARLQNIDRNRFIAKNIQYVTREKSEDLARHTFVPNDILITKLGDPLGKACLAPTTIEKGVLVADVVRARLTHEWVDRRFLCYQINSENIVEQFKDQTKGTTRPRVNLTKIRSLKARLCPLLEQTRIVAKVEELMSDLDAGVAELKAAQKKLGQYRHSLLKAAVQGSLTAEWRTLNALAETGAQLLERILAERRTRWEARQLEKFAAQGKTLSIDWQKGYPEPVRPDTTGLPELPNGWVWASIDQLTVEQRYGSSSKTSEDSTGVPVLRMGNIQDGELDFSNLKYLPLDHDEFPSLHLQDGDLLFNRTNSPELVGKTAVYRSQMSPCSFASYLISVRFSKGYVPELASAFINSAFGKHWIKSVVVQQVGQANVNGSKLSALAVPLPPFDEQKEIISSLEAQTKVVVDQLKNVDVSLKRSTAQRQNILRAAFAGQLVPQDPNDEPASVLLERIRTEQEERSQQPKIRKTKQQKGITAVVRKLIDVLAEAGDWMPAQEVFRRCGIADGTPTDQIEELYAQLRVLDKAGRLAVEAVTDTQGRKLHDRLKLLAG